jgi:anti-anti-sigma factor
VPHANATASPFPATAPSGFRHDAVFYGGERCFLPTLMPFVSAALERDEPLLVALVPAREDALRGELGDASRRVEFVDMQSAGRNPARIIPVWRDFVTRHAGSGKTLNGVGEPIWSARSDPEIAECQRHESLLNLAFADAGAFALVCPYDEAGLPAGVLAAARESHPHVVEGGRRCASTAYQGTEDIGAADRRPLSPPPAIHHARAFSAADVTSVRRETEEWASAQGLEARGHRQQHPARRRARSAAAVEGGRRPGLRDRRCRRAERPPGRPVTAGRRFPERQGSLAHQPPLRSRPGPVRCVGNDRPGATATAPEVVTEDDAAAPEAPIFSVVVADAGMGRSVVAAAGELDIATAPRLLEAVATLERSGTRAFAIDLSALTFIDSSGINALRAAVRSAHERGVGAIVAAPSARVQRVLDLVKLGEIVPVEPSLPAAFERLDASGFGGPLVG